MTIGGSLLLVAVGAILRYATNLSIKGVDVDEVGLILMIVGIVGFVIALVYELVAAGGRARFFPYRGRERYYAPPRPGAPPPPHYPEPPPPRERPPPGSGTPPRRYYE